MFVLGRCSFTQQTNEQQKHQHWKSFCHILVPQIRCLPSLSFLFIIHIFLLFQFVVHEIRFDMDCSIISIESIIQRLCSFGEKKLSSDRGFVIQFSFVRMTPLCLFLSLSEDSLVRRSSSCDIAPLRAIRKTQAKTGFFFTRSKAVSTWPVRSRCLLLLSELKIKIKCTSSHGLRPPQPTAIRPLTPRYISSYLSHRIRPIHRILRTTQLFHRCYLFCHTKQTDKRNAIRYNPLINTYLVGVRVRFSFKTRPRIKKQNFGQMLLCVLHKYTLFLALSMEHMANEETAEATWTTTVKMHCASS